MICAPAVSLPTTVAAMDFPFRASAACWTCSGNWTNRIAFSPFLFLDFLEYLNSGLEFDAVRACLTGLLELMGSQEVVVLPRCTTSQGSPLGGMLLSCGLVALLADSMSTQG